GIRARNVTGVQTCALPIYGVVMMKSPLPTHERDLLYFPPRVSVRIHEWYPVNELAEDRNAKPPVARRSREFGGNRIPITSSRVEIGRASCRERVEIPSGRV